MQKYINVEKYKSTKEESQKNINVEMQKCRKKEKLKS